MDDDDDFFGYSNEAERTLNMLGDVPVTLTLPAGTWFTVLEAVDRDLYRDAHVDLTAAIEIARLRMVGQLDQAQAGFAEHMEGD